MGAERRLNVLRLVNRFSSSPSDSAEDGGLKARIKRGDYVYDLLYVCSLLYPALELETTNVTKSPAIEEETALALMPDDGEEQSEQSFAHWVEATFVKASVAQASRETDVKKLVAEKLACKPRTAPNLMREKGFTFGFHDGKGKRYVKYRFANSTSAEPVAMRTASSSSSAAAP